MQPSRWRCPSSIRFGRCILLIFVLQSASATFTPTFQATIPDILPDENQYTRALSLSRLAYDMESLPSPMLAAALLTIITFNWLFVGTVVGFLCSAALVLSVIIPQPERSERGGGIYDNTTRGIRIYLATPRLRGLLALNLSVATAGAMVIVNTVVIVRGLLGGTDSDVAIALACFGGGGGGSMTATLLLPRLLDRLPDRTVMLPSASMLGVTLLGFGILMPTASGAGHMPCGDNRMTKSSCTARSLSSLSIQTRQIGRIAATGLSFARRHSGLSPNTPFVVMFETGT